jgi:hypothetical protein
VEWSERATNPAESPSGFTLPSYNVNFIRGDGGQVRSRGLEPPRYFYH